MATRKIRIVMADDHAIFRRGLQAMLEGSQGFSIVAECGDGEQAVQLVAEHVPDVVLLDISMPKLNGVEAARLIKRYHPEVRVLILSVHEDRDYIYQVVRAGADGYVFKSVEKKELIAAIRTVVEGGRFFSQSVSNVIVSQFASHARHDKEPGSVSMLTRRENDVLRRIAEGKTSRAIAEELVLSVRTVNTHRANLMHKLDIHEKAGLVRYAIQTGLVDLRDK
jgi:two-component system response regulator NreC